MPPGWRNDIANVAECLGSIPGPVNSGTVTPPLRLSLELCFPGTKSRRWIPPLVSRFGVIPRVQGLVFCGCCNETSEASAFKLCQGTGLVSSLSNLLQGIAEKRYIVLLNEYSFV